MESRSLDFPMDGFKKVSTYFSAPFRFMCAGSSQEIPLDTGSVRSASEPSFNMEYPITSANDMSLKSNFTGNHLICKPEIDLLHFIDTLGFYHLAIKCFPVL